MTEKAFLITTPYDNDAIFYCNTWSKKIIPLAEKKGLIIIELTADKVTQINVESHLGNPNIRFVLFNGHGNPDVITGSRGQPIIKNGENEGVLKGKIVYALSCFTLQGLGASSVRAGADAYVGYTLPFTFISDPTRGANPLQDELAEPCFTTSNLIPTTILKGNSIAEAVDKAKTEMLNRRDEWEVRTDLVEAPFVASCLHWNAAGLGYEGKPNTRL